MATSCNIGEVKLLSDEKEWSNNPGASVPVGLAGLVTSGRCSATWGEGGLSTVVTHTVAALVGGELEGGDLERPFIFFL